MRAERRDRPDVSLVEVMRRGARAGIVLEVGAMSGMAMRHLLELSFDLAGSLPRRFVTDPGWWAACVAATAINTGHVCIVQRIRAVDVAGRHALVLVEPGSMIEPYPHWPMVKLDATSRHELDLRGETALLHGPSDVELADYRRDLVDAPSLLDLRRMFEMGVIEFESGENRGGRRALCAAALH